MRTYAVNPVRLGSSGVVAPTPHMVHLICTSIPWIYTYFSIFLTSLPVALDTCECIKFPIPLIKIIPPIK